jgi:VWFA-related protein
MKPLASVAAATLMIWAAGSAYSRAQEGPLRPDPTTAGDKAPPPEVADSDKTISVSVNIVNILAAVRDKHGALIPTLSKDDFQIFENGKEQTIKYFTKETNLPLTIGLLVDVSRSQENLIGIEQSAASAFLDSVLRPKDEAFIISFGADSELLQDLTSSKKALHRGLNDLKPNFGFSGVTPGPVPTATSQAGTVLYDATYLAASDRLAHEVGRKAIVVITDGDDEGSRLSIKKAIESAQRSDVTIYSIYYADTSFYMRHGMIGGGGGRHALEQMSGETGGHVFDVSRRNGLDKVFDELQEEMRTQYSIGYTPQDDRRDGSYRKIEVRVKDHDLKVEARKGYYATPPEKE